MVVDFTLEGESFDNLFRSCMSACVLVLLFFLQFAIGHCLVD